jgi:hypothetical protein
MSATRGPVWGGRGGGRGSSVLAARDTAVVPERVRGIGEGRINRSADGPAWVEIR